jgi:hypothetical protein
MKNEVSIRPQRATVPIFLQFPLLISNQDTYKERRKELKSAEELFMYIYMPLHGAAFRDWPVMRAREVEKYFVWSQPAAQKR